MTRTDLHKPHDPKLTLAPPSRRRYGRQLRFLWGQGMFSGLPLAEFVLLAAFLASAGMFLTAHDNAPVANSAHPLETQSILTIY